MSSPRARVLMSLVCTLAFGGGVWLLLDAGTASESTAQLAPAPVRVVPPAIPPKHMPPPFTERKIRKPDATQAMEPAPSQTAAFCADENWGRMDGTGGLDGLIASAEAGEFRVDPAAWNRNLTGTRAGIASWMSHCKGDGRAVRIVAADTGALLATYDADSGLREP